MTNLPGHWEVDNNYKTRKAKNLKVHIKSQRFIMLL